MAGTAKPPVQPPQLGSAQIAEAIATGNLAALGIGAPEGNQRRTIGAPEEVLARNPNLPPDFVPWLDGDEWEPAAFGPDARATLKAFLNSAGLYPGGKASSAPGAWTGEDAQALVPVLEYANGAGISDIAMAAREFARQAEVVGPAAKKPRAPLVTRLSNPDSVRQIVRQTSLNLTGRRLSDEEEARIVDGFRSQEAGFAQAAYNADEGGGTITEPMDAEGYAAAKLENAPGAGARRYMAAFEQIHKSLTGTVTEGPQLADSGEVRY